MASRRYRTIGSLVALLLVALAAPGPAAAVPYTSYTLSATAISLIMPDGRTINFWAYADVTPAGTGGRAAGVGGDGIPTVPGPVLEFPTGVPVTITLQNNLAFANGGNNPLLTNVPTSLIIPGQFQVGAARPAGTNVPLVPTVIAGVLENPRAFTFSNQVGPGQAVTYTFGPMRPGTFLYESGSHPQVQIPMGLYGAVIVRDTNPAQANKAYGAADPAGKSSFDYEAPPVLFSEVDPNLNTLVSLAPQGPFSTVLFTPRYFLINGQSYPKTQDITAAFSPAGPQRTLIRMLNAGSRDCVPLIAGYDVSIVAEDGNLRPTARKENAPSLSAGKTFDLILATPTAASAKGYFPLYDRALGQVNNTIFSALLLQPAGMMTFLGVYPVHTAGPLAGTPQNCSPIKGDVNGDGVITIADALHVLRAAVGIVDPGITIANGNVSPVDADTGLPCGDYSPTTGADQLLATDALFVLQKAIGANPY
jgi:FtsP/CotA-like multicopper oxidase with cupredoxin domain